MSLAKEMEAISRSILADAEERLSVMAPSLTMLLDLECMEWVRGVGWKVHMPYGPTRLFPANRHGGRLGSERAARSWRNAPAMRWALHLNKRPLR